VFMQEEQNQKQQSFVWVLNISMWNLLIPVLSIAFEILSVDASLLFRLEIYVQVNRQGE
jgi:hypothetical protein